MRLIFVRHGEPDYEKDRLTERGKQQAQAAAQRLLREGISEICASPMGRAYETACYTAKLLGLPVRVLEYMHEIVWGGEGIPEDGHPWTLGDHMLEEGFAFVRDNWREHPYFKNNYATEYYDRVGNCFDEFLKEKGYRQEGSRFFCTMDREENVAIFSHGGSGACVLSRILSMPFPYVISVLPYDFTSVIIVDLPVRKDAYVHARLELFNDVAHILGMSDGLMIQQKM